MKRFILLILALCALHGASAQSATTVLSQMQQAIAALGSYEATFAVNAGGASADGRYMVDGERYYISTGDVEVYGDARQKFEVINSRREVVADRADAERSDLLSNPSRAFETLNAEFAVEAFNVRPTVYVLQLKARASTAPVRSLTVKVRRADMLPVELAYDTSSEHIVITLHRVEKLSAEQMLLFDKSRYKGYDLIDFR